MAFLSLVLALLLEQWRPLSDRRSLFVPVERYARFLERQFNAGEAQHGTIAWLCAVLPAVLVTWLAYALLEHASPLAALAFNVAALYVTLGFRQFSHYFTDIQLALKEDDIERARSLLSGWRGQSCAGLSSEEIVRLTIEEALAACHRHVFAVAFWFVVLPGPTGAVLYRLCYLLRERWAPDLSPELEGFGRFPALAFEVLDWLPARLTAMTFAIVGDFEDAVYCWRSQAEQWGDRTAGVVLAAGAGALGVKLGNPYLCDGTVVERPELGLGDLADVAFLDSVVGLVWRALVLWLALILMMSVVRAIA
jgi:cobalamin biosynthesis protein CobD/CbiB